MISRNVPEENSSIPDCASLSRSMDLGVKTTSGRRGLA